MSPALTLPVWQERGWAGVRSLLSSSLGILGRTSHVSDVIRLHVGRGAVLALDGLVHFLAMNGDLRRSIDPQSYLVSANIDHRDLDIIADHDRLISLSG